jgi:hypothetical protein
MISYIVVAIPHWRYGTIPHQDLKDVSRNSNYILEIKDIL